MQLDKYVPRYNTLTRRLFQAIHKKKNMFRGYEVMNWMLNPYMPRHGTTLHHKPPVLKKFTS